MFSEIKQYKTLGFNKSQVERTLNINYKTVQKYWDMTPDEYSKATIESKCRHKKIDIYKDDILEWITDFRDMSAAQVLDWIKERYGVVQFKERSLRLYISNLRQEYNLPKTLAIRQFEEVPQLPMGYQAQVDMGQIWLKRLNGSKLKVYCFAMVLSHSRYKYVLWTDKPFTTVSFIDAHNRAFEYLGGMPVEIVYDQDRILAVSENSGDIIYTEGFQNYIDTMKYKVRLCRGFDPQSKGKVESVVKYAKYNFAINRIFIDIDSFNEDSFKWLVRTGNGKKHEVTKKIPAEVFALEKKHLLPVPELFEKNSSNISLTYAVRKNNIILYKQNRYQVPKGTYSPGKEINLMLKGSKMNIVDFETGELIASHQLSTRQGELIKIIHPERDIHSSVDEVYEKVFAALGKTVNAKVLLDSIRREKSRYCKDQFGVILNIAPSYEASLIERALSYCVTRNLWSAGMFKETLEYLAIQDSTKVDKVPGLDKVLIPSKYRGLKPEVRCISDYSDALKEDKHSWKNYN
ncbi:MAG: IS21 family transposase [Peptostreptococcaceae bacterium]|nr:IS21 family transposase [Peptostreptococcaceae bacterium]